MGLKDPDESPTRARREPKEAMRAMATDGDDARVPSSADGGGSPPRRPWRGPAGETVDTQRAAWTDLVTGLYRRHFVPWADAAERWIGDRGAAEELVQAAFAGLLEEPGTPAPLTWAWAALERLAAAHLGGATDDVRDRSGDSQPPSAPGGSILRAMNPNSDAAGAVWTDAERRALALRAEGLAYQEIGRRLGVSADDVARVLWTALQKAVGPEPESAHRPADSGDADTRRTP
jgi:DNA-directed RNA polymerase specialized sigma24 family protein